MNNGDKGYQELEKQMRAVQRQEDGRKLIYLNEEEERALNKMIARERAWQALGLLGGSIKAIALWIGIVLATWAALKAGILEWLAMNLPR